ncbi:MAG: TraM recognition domain-containing protein, partial [Micromonosporaceae bacterium]|nr:TraM recognition domain-containing protein [Micromonosporaceae bacterium]
AAKGTRHESHWTSRASALLGPLLYAAASVRLQMRDVVGWVLSGDINTADLILEWAADRGDGDADLARMVLGGVQRAADQERQSIWSATADVIDVYTTDQALDSCERSNWEPHQFAASADTVYVAAPAEHQAAVAPLVVALIEAVRDAQYSRHRAAALAEIPHGKPVSLVLDEVANIAPIASLPALVSEAGGQGLHTIAAVQDLSQVRGRWGADIADGFLSPVPAPGRAARHPRHQDARSPQRDLRGVGPPPNLHHPHQDQVAGALSGPLAVHLDRGHHQLVHDPAAAADARRDLRHARRPSAVPVRVRVAAHHPRAPLLPSPLADRARLGARPDRGLGTSRHPPAVDRRPRAGTGAGGAPRTPRPRPSTTATAPGPARS